MVGFASNRRRGNLMFVTGTQGNEWGSRKCGGGLGERGPVAGNGPGVPPRALLSFFAQLDDGSSLLCIWIPFHVHT